MNKVLERIGRSRNRDLFVPAAKYSREWHDQLRSGADIRAWRKSVGLYVKELAELLGVVVPTVIRAEQSESPSSRIVYGVELLRAKVLSGELDLRCLRKIALSARTNRTRDEAPFWKNTFLQVALSVMHY